MTSHQVPRTLGNPPARTPGGERLPWVALGSMSFTVLVVVSAEMLPTAVLPQLAADLDVSLASVGMLVSAWAATVVLATVPLTSLTARLDRRALIVGSLVVVALATLVTGSARSYGLVLGSRLVAAGATGLLWSTINAHAASIVPEHRIARATSVVLAGGTVGTVAAIPLGSAVAGSLGWRAPFIGLGALALVAALVVALALRPVPGAAEGDAAPAPEVGASRAGAPRPRGDDGSRPRLWPVLATGGLGGLVLVAHFVPFTFVAELLAGSPVPLPVLLVLFGVAGAGGVAIVGAVSDRHARSTPVAWALAMVTALASLVLLGRGGAGDVALVLWWGTVLGAGGPAIQSSVMRLAGSAHRRTAGTVMPVAMNLGIAVGAALGSGAVDRWDVGALPLLGVVPAALAVLGLLAVARGLGDPRR